MVMNVIDFFIIGVQKGGTTALHKYLSSHPDIQMPLKKEIHFFNNEDIDWTSPDYAALHKFFDWTVSGVVRGEATPAYIYWSGAISRIYEYNPNCKLILCLRHPAYRAYSAYRMYSSTNEETLSFENAISEIGRSRVKESPRGLHLVYSYVERGFYYNQIDCLLNIFPRARVFFMRTDELWNNLSVVLSKIEQFLGVRNIISGKAIREYILPLQSKDVSVLSDDNLKKLNDIFRSDIMNTSKLIGIDLSDWCSDDYQEPMRG